MAGGPQPGFMPAGLPSNYDPNNGAGPSATWLSNFLYRVVFGPGSAPHDGSAAATAESFNPLHRTGLLNLASMFVGGPKGDATPVMESLGMKGQFAPYQSVVYHTGSPLDRGIAHEGPVSPTGGTQGAGIHGLVRRAQGVSPFNRPDPAKAAAARHALVEKQVADALERQRNIRAMAARKQLDAKLGSAPMAGTAPHPAAEHDYFTAPQFDKHVDESIVPVGHEGPDPRQVLIRHLVQQRYHAQLGHNHLN